MNNIELYRDYEIAHQNLVLTGGADHQGGGDKVNLNALLATLRRRRALFFGVFLAIVLLILGMTLWQTPLYSASSQVVIDNRPVQVTPVIEQVAPDSSDVSSPIVDTEVEVIRSSELANQVADALKLDKIPMLDPANAVPGRWASFKSWITGDPLPVSPRAYDPQAQREYVLKFLKSRLDVTRTGLTYALTISYSSTNPSFSAQVANEYARQYSILAQQRKRKENAEAVAFLGGRIEELRRQAQTDTRAVQDYRVAHNLLSATAAQLTEQEVSVYDQQLAQARASAAEDRARLATAQQQLKKGSQGDDVGAALQSPVVSSLRTQRAQLASELANLKARYGPLHPDIIKLQQQVNDLDRSIQTEINRVISNLQANTNVSGQRLSSVAGSLGGARGTLAASNKSLVGFDDLTRKADASQGLYEAYLNRYKAAAAQQGTETADARVVSWAQPPELPSSPNVTLNLIFALAIGLGAGLAAAFGAELMFSGLTTGEDVETQLNVPYLGTIPLLSSVIDRPPSPFEAVAEHPHSSFNASLRSLRASIDYSVKAVVQVIAVTSALPKEGKSTIAACLARLAAIDGEKVVLIDCDPRRRAVNKLIDVPSKAGLIEVLRGEASLSDALVLHAESGVWMLPINQTPVDGGELVSGNALADVIQSLREEFTYIVIDTAPVMPVVDARVVTTLADAVLFVTRWRKTPDHAVRNALKLLPAGRMHLAGVALSQVDMRKQARFGHGDATAYYDRYKEYYA